MLPLNGLRRTNILCATTVLFVYNALCRAMQASHGVSAGSSMWTMQCIFTRKPSPWPRGHGASTCSPTPSITPLTATQTAFSGGVLQRSLCLPVKLRWGCLLQSMQVPLTTAGSAFSGRCVSPHSLGCSHNCAGAAQCIACSCRLVVHLPQPTTLCSSPMQACPCDPGQQPLQAAIAIPTGATSLSFLLIFEPLPIASVALRVMLHCMSCCCGHCHHCSSLNI